MPILGTLLGGLASIFRNPAPQVNEELRRKMFEDPNRGGVALSQGGQRPLTPDNVGPINPMRPEPTQPMQGLQRNVPTSPNDIAPTINPLTGTVKGGMVDANGTPGVAGSATATGTQSLLPREGGGTTPVVAPQPSTSSAPAANLGAATNNFVNTLGTLGGAVAPPPANVASMLKPAGEMLRGTTPPPPVPGMKPTADLFTRTPSATSQRFATSGQALAPSRPPVTSQTPTGSLRRKDDKGNEVAVTITRGADGTIQFVDPANVTEAQLDLFASATAAEKAMALGELTDASQERRGRDGRVYRSYRGKDGTRVLVDMQTGDFVDPKSMSPDDYNLLNARNIDARTAYQGEIGYQNNATFDPSGFSRAVRVNGQLQNVVTHVRDLGDGRFELISLNDNGKLLTPAEAETAMANGRGLSLGTYTSKAEADAAAVSIKQKVESGAYDPAQGANIRAARAADTAARGATEKTYEFKQDGKKIEVFYRGGVFRNAATGEVVSGASDDKKLRQKAEDDYALRTAATPEEQARVRLAIANRKAMEAANPDFGKQKRGFWNALKAMGLGALRGFATGGIGGAIGGAVAGGVIGAFDPTFDDFLKNEMFTKPKADAELKAAQEGFKYFQERQKAAADIQQQVLQNLNLNETNRKLNAEAFQIVLNSNVVWQARKGNSMNWAEIQAFEESMTRDLIARDLLQEGERYVSGLTPFNLTEMVQVQLPDGSLGYRHKNSPVIIPARMHETNAPVRFQSAAEGVITLALADGSTIDLRDSNANLAKLVVQIATFNATTVRNRQEFEATLQARIDTDNAKALNDRQEALDRIGVEVAKAQGNVAGTQQKWNEITSQLTAKRAELAQLETSLAGQRVTEADRQRLNQLREQIFKMQQDAFTAVSENKSAITLDANLQQLLNAQQEVQLVTMPKLGTAPILQITGPNPNAPKQVSGPGVPGPAYAPPANSDATVENTIGSNIVNPVNPRGRRNLSA